MRLRLTGGLRPPLAFALAALVTLANVAKPVAVDDTAYLLFARHIAGHPLDPYGFTIFWWDDPDPAMAVLCPPVVPYWLALGVRLFGEHVGLLKLWLFPFVWLLAWALNALLTRFARGTERAALPLLMLSPAVLPAVNLMLDVPALALAFAAVELFLRAAARGSWRSAALAGVVAGLAMQTKYSAFAAPAVIAWAGLVHRRPALAGVAVGLCVAVFAGWELALVQKYGQSHFLFHAGASGGRGPRAFLEDKFDLLAPLAGHLGCLAVGPGLLALAAVGVPRRWVAGIAAVWGVGFALVALLPHRWTMLNEGVSAVTAFWQISGQVWLAAAVALAAVLVLRVKRGRKLRANRAALFLAGWLAIEVGAAVGLTPFPAARRVFGLTLVAGLIAARGVGRIGRARPPRRAPRWAFAVGVAAGVVVAALDTFDAFPEKVCAQEAAWLTRDRAPGVTAWYVGHWGLQYYCERAGMQPLIAKRTVARAGDYLVLPVYPPGDRFPRPYAGFRVTHPDPADAEFVGQVECHDPLSAKTVPNFYGGTDPVSGRDAPRLRVRVYRLTRDWVMK